MVLFGTMMSSILFISNMHSQSIPRFEDVSKYYGDPTTITTNDILNTKGLDDPLSQWAKELGPDWVKWISDKGEWFIDAKDNLLKTTQRVINYLLGFLAFISLILLIYNWFVFLLSPKDENIKKAKDIIIKILWALVGIGISWILVTSIFWIIAKSIGK